MAINLAGNGFNKYTGYGRMCAYFVRELCALGVEVVPALVDEHDVTHAPQWILDALQPLDRDALTISLTIPPIFPTGLKRQWAFTMYEDTKIPEGWADIINADCERLIVLCEHNAETFERAGVNDKFPVARIQIEVEYGVGVGMDRTNGVVGYLAGCGS